MIAQLPDTPRVYFLDLDRSGSDTATYAYHHFHAYIQARRGGCIAFSLPELFRKIPVRLRENAGVSKLSVESEWYPRRFDDNEVNDFYDHVLVRNGARQRGFDPLAENPYERIDSKPLRELYRRPAGGSVE